MALTKAEITHLRGLRSKKNREAAGQFIVEGEKVVRELATTGHPFMSIYATSAWEATEVDGVIAITESEMARISHYPTPSSVLAVGWLKRGQIRSGELNSGLTLALDGIQDPGNVGTLLRIADWFDFDRVVISPDSADLFSQKVINASMGSFARMRIVAATLADALSSPTVPVIGCDLNGTPLTETTAARDAVVVIGSEGRGISEAVQTCLTERVTIPRFGRAESLNAAVAAGIICAHLRSSV